MRVWMLCLLVLLFKLSFSRTQSAECALKFPAIKSLPAGINASAVVVGDFNNDQKPDLVVVSMSTAYNIPMGTVTVWLNDGGRNFRKGGDFALNGSARCMAAGDLNGDGALDLVVGCYDTGLEVLFGEGNGNFKMPERFGGRYVNSVALADFDGDGHLEVLVAQDDGRLIVFPSGREYLNATRPRGVQVGDFNGDGKMDFVATDFQPKRLVIMVGNGDGTFEWKGDVPMETEGGFVTCGDVDGDGNVDIVASGVSTLSLLVFYGKGDATFEAAAPSTTGYYPASGVIADFDNNGKMDLASVQVSSGTVALLLNGGNRHFGPPMTYTAGGLPSSVVAADFDNDGFKDVAVANQMPYGWQSAVSVLWGKGGAGFDAPRDVDLGFEPGITSVADYNKDGRPDILAVDPSNLHFLCALNEGSAKFKANDGNALGYYVTGLPVTSDFDGDAYPDVAFPIMSVQRPPQPGFPPPFPPSYGVSVFRGSATGSFSNDSFVGVSGVTVFSLVSSLVVGKFNGDDRTDMAVLLPWENKISVFMEDPRTGFQGPVNYPVGPQPNQGTAVDVDGDSKLDLIVSHQQGLSLLRGVGDGSFEAAVSVVTNGWGTVVAGDFNGDGKPDLVAPTLQGNLGLWINRGNRNFELGTDYPLAGVAGRIVLADLDGDTRLDVVVENSAGVSVFLGNGDGTLRAYSHHPVGENPRSLVVADFTGDGRPDIGIVSGTLTARLWLLENKCATSESRLSFEKRQGQLSISWKTIEPGMLESTTNLNSPQWEIFSGEQVGEADQIKTSAPLADPSRYFRLRRNP
jgi:hypothetical protein